MSRKLLLADDSITIQKVIQITFAHEDYELTITDNGDAAWAKVQELEPDLVMADVYMPGKNGYELAAAIKQDAALQHIPVLLLAGSFEPFDEDKAKSCRADAWIEKPFESQTLIDKVNELLAAAPAPAGAAAAPPEPAAVEPEPVPDEPTPPVVGAEEAGGEPQPAAAPTPEETDPFADISFDAEPSSEEPAPELPEDDWGDVAEAVGEPGPQPAEEETFTFAEEEAAELPDMEPDLEPDLEEDFTFAEEPETEETPLAAPDFEVAEEIDEVMPLDDEDILGAEDLEPAPAEQTLASWSRDAAAEGIFGESTDEEEASEPDVFSAEPFAGEETSLGPAEETLPVETEDVLPAEPPAAEEPFAPEAPASSGEPAPAEEDVVADFGTEFSAPAAAEEEVETSPASEPVQMAATIEEVERKAAGLSEADLEAIVEKVAGKVIEKLADTVLERVAWEVVPDLAESLIREEIRKIKETAA